MERSFSFVVVLSTCSSLASRCAPRVQQGCPIRMRPTSQRPRDLLPPPPSALSRAPPARVLLQPSHAGSKSGPACCRYVEHFLSSGALGMVCRMPGRLQREQQVRCPLPVQPSAVPAWLACRGRGRARWRGRQPVVAGGMLSAETVTVRGACMSPGLAHKELGCKPVRCKSKGGCDCARPDRPDPACTIACTLPDAQAPLRRAQLGMSRIDFLYEGRDAVEVKTPLNAFPLDRIGNPHLLRVRARARPLPRVAQRLHCGACGAALACVQAVWSMRLHSGEP